MSFIYYKPVNINIIQINNDFGIFLYTSGFIFPNFKLKKYKERCFKVKKKPIQCRSYFPSNYFQQDICDFLSKKISDKYNCHIYSLSIDNIPKDKIDEYLIEMYSDELDNLQQKIQPPQISLEIPLELPEEITVPIVVNKTKTEILETIVESIQEPIEIYKCPILDNNKQPKINISHLMKRMVWDKWIGEEIGKTKCPCCKMSEITQLTFIAGHIHAESRGGEYSVENLIPICQSCNLSMGTKNMHEFMKTHRLNIIQEDVADIKNKNPWIQHVQEFAKKNNIEYGKALSSPECKTTYKKESMKQ